MDQKYLKERDGHYQRSHQKHDKAMRQQPALAAAGQQIAITLGQQNWDNDCKTSRYKPKAG
jgi:hypothetical protein